MVAGLSDMSKFAFERNIERYEKLLKSDLTDMERDFIERRLSEEKQALQLQQTFLRTFDLTATE
jgi:hypothetical protein